jgi:enolase
MSKIKDIKAREILDSRGIPTVEASIELTDGNLSRASVPSGTSTGRHEAVEVRDMNGRGVKRAVTCIVGKIAPKLHGHELGSQSKVDDLLISLDGTENKKKLGANSILAVSIASLRAKSLTRKEILAETIAREFGFVISDVPSPMAVVIEGGKHSASNLDFQEFMIVATSGRLTERIEKIQTVYENLGGKLKILGRNNNVGLEGAYGPNFSSNREALDFIMRSIEESKLRPGKDLKISLDVAASSFWDPNSKKYFLKLENKALDTKQMIAFMESLLADYPIFSIEDPLDEDDWSGWKELRRHIGQKTILIGDDLFVTNKKRIERGIEEEAANAVLIKPNQIGTVTETVEAIKLAQQVGWMPVISHRSGETNDDFIIDLAVGTNTPYVKIGAPARGERVAKYNRLLEINGILKK